MDHFFSVRLSAGYFDILKDRLYTHEAASLSRRSAQTVLAGILRDFVVAVAPILSFTAEEIWQVLPESLRGKGGASVFQAPWPLLDGPVGNSPAQEWEWIFAVKGAVSKSLESLRQEKKIGSSLEGEVDLYVENDKLREALLKHSENLRYYFLVSNLNIQEGTAPPEAKPAEDPGLKLKTVARKSEGIKCARCWNYYAPVQMDKVHPDICHRCGPVVAKFEAAGAWKPA